MKFQKVLDVMKNQFFVIAKDPGAILILVIGVILYSLIYAIPYATELIKDVPVAVVDLDNSTLSRTFTSNMDASDYVQVSQKLSNVQEAKEEFYQDDVKAYIVIPQDFERNLKRGKKINVSLYSDASYLLIYKAVTSGVVTTANEFSAGLEIKKLIKNGASKQEALNQVRPFEMVSIPLFNPSGGYESYLYPLILVLIIQQTLLVGIGLMDGSARERALKGEAFCKVSNHPSEIILGKTLAFTSIYLIHSFTYFIIYPAIHDYTMYYNLLAMYAILIPYLFASCFLAQSLVYFFTEREGSLLTITLTSLPIIFVAGFLWPKESLPAWMAALAFALPSTPAINGIVRINQMGASFYQVLPDFLILLGLCILYYIVAFWVVQKIK